MTKPSLHLAVSLFIILQIQKLVRWQFISTPADPRLPAEFPGHTAFRLTALKVLHIIFSYIDIGSVANILTFPSALTHLGLGITNGLVILFIFHNLFQMDMWKRLGLRMIFVELCVLQQRHSLGTLNATGWDESPPPNEQD